MGFTRPALAALATTALLTGCFAYNKPAKKWAYVGDTLMVLGGGGVVALELTGTSEMCVPGPSSVCPYDSPVTGALVAGAVLITAGVVGMILNATRPEVKSSR